MLTAADDYPLHQSPEPFAFAGGGRNFYDRFFFNGYDAAGDVFFAVALGVYPQLNIMDAGFCVSLDGRQHNLRASKEMLGERLNLSVGPINIEILAPLKKTRIKIAENDFGVSGELVATKRHAAIEEPRFSRRNGTRVFMDYTRATQNIAWEGSVLLDGQAISVDGCLGTRDRSWGVRPVGAADPQPPVPPPKNPQFYWLWTPANFEKACLFAHSNDDADGAAWNQRGVIDFWEARHDYEAVQFTPQYETNTRRLKNLQIAFGGDARAAFSPQNTRFYMQGLGYMHPEWGHGMHHGESRVGFDVLDVEQAEVDLKGGKMHNLHIQQLCQVALERRGKTLHGQGVIEQLFIGPHAPSGFEGFSDRILG